MPSTPFSFQLESTLDETTCYMQHLRGTCGLQFITLQNSRELVLHKKKKKL